MLQLRVRKRTSFRSQLTATGVGSRTTSLLTVESKGFVVTTVVKCATSRKYADNQKGIPGYNHQRTHRLKTVLEVVDTDTESEEDVQYLNYMVAKPAGAIKVEVLLDRKPVSMELDTRVPVSLMSRRMMDNLFPGYTLQPCSLPM